VKRLLTPTWLGLFLICPCAPRCTCQGDSSVVSDPAPAPSYDPWVGNSDGGPCAPGTVLCTLCYGLELCIEPTICRDVAPCPPEAGKADAGADAPGGDASWAADADAVGDAPGDADAPSPADADRERAEAGENGDADDLADGSALDGSVLAPGDP
jgi:hypothetical protein